jgi:predicted transglutaminase-like protease
MSRLAGESGGGLFFSRQWVRGHILFFACQHFRKFQEQKSILGLQHDLGTTFLKYDISCVSILQFMTMMFIARTKKS